MRILGFCKLWPKLAAEQFTTFRFARKDRDWEVGEPVQIVIKPRSKTRAFIGIAQIIHKEKRAMARYGDKTGETKVSNEEAHADGFEQDSEKEAYFNMWEFLWGRYGGERLLSEPMNKLTLAWVDKAT